MVDEGLSRRHFLRIAGIAVAGAGLLGCDVFPQARPAAPVEAEVAGPQDALQRLKDGNARFVAGKMVQTNLAAERRSSLTEVQQPFAVIFGCVDSRVPPELVFDRGLGDLLVVRTAGPTLGAAAMGSIEFGIAKLGIPLVVVLGHERCGAIETTIEALEKGKKAEGDMGALIDRIRPAVEQARGQAGDPVDRAVRTHVALTVTALGRSPILADAVRQGKLAIVGAHYTLASGTVQFAGL